jgi:hypothetical protein
MSQPFVGNPQTLLRMSVTWKRFGIRMRCQEEIEMKSSTYEGIYLARAKP